VTRGKWQIRMLWRHRGLSCDRLLRQWSLPRGWLWCKVGHHPSPDGGIRVSRVNRDPGSWVSSYRRSWPASVLVGCLTWRPKEFAVG